MSVDGVNGPKGPGAAGGAVPTESPAPATVARDVPAAPAAEVPAAPPPARLDDPTLAALVAQARAIAAELRAGTVESREEATRRLVREVLSRRLKLRGSALSGRIASALKDDPRLGQALERIWSEEG
jgi:hypothetical protein